MTFSFLDQSLYGSTAPEAGGGVAAPAPTMTAPRMAYKVAEASVPRPQATPSTEAAPDPDDTGAAATNMDQFLAQLVLRLSATEKRNALLEQRISTSLERLHEQEQQKLQQAINPFWCCVLVLILGFCLFLAIRYCIMSSSSAPTVLVPSPHLGSRFYSMPSPPTTFL